MAIVLKCASASVFNYSAAQAAIYLPELSNTVGRKFISRAAIRHTVGHNDVSAARIFLPIALHVELWTTSFAMLKWRVNTLR